MSSERRTYRLGDLCDFINGFAFKSTDYVEKTEETWEVLRMGYISRGGGFKEDSSPVFVPKLYTKNLTKYFLRPKDIVIAMTDMKNNVAILGNTAFIQDAQRFVLNQRVGCLRVLRSDLVTPEYLYYYSNWAPHVEYLRQRANSGVQVNLSTSAIKDAEIELPCITEQIQIGQFLSALDDRITLLRETNVTLEAIAQALFKSWFVDFDPVRAKMEGRVPEGMDEETATLFPDGFEETKLGSVPKGWRIGQVHDLGDVVCGKTPATSVAENYGVDVPFITIPDMHNVLAVTSTSRHLSRLGANSQVKKYLAPGSICVSCIATPGLVVRVTKTAQTNQQINSVIPFLKWGKAFPLFLLRMIGDAVRTSGSGGSVFHNLSKSRFEKLPVMLTTPEIAQKFDEVAEPLVEKITSNQCQAQTLTTLRDTLLPRLISGQLRLPEAKSIIAEHAA